MNLYLGWYVLKYICHRGDCDVKCCVLMNAVAFPDILPLQYVKNDKFEL